MIGKMIANHLTHDHHGSSSQPRSAKPLGLKRSARPPEIASDRAGIANHHLDIRIARTSRRTDRIGIQFRIGHRNPRLLRYRFD